MWTSPRSRLARHLLKTCRVVVSGFVVTLCSDPILRAQGIARLIEQPGVTIGEPTDDRWPVVAETSTLEAGAALVTELGNAAGIVRVDVVSIDFEVMGDA
jgi:hypothetical protein